MSQRNKPEAKKLRMLERSLRKGRLPRYLNLIHWLEDHGHAETAGEARKLVKEKRVRHESHPVGVTIIDREVEGQEEPEKVEVFNFRVPSNLRNGIEVVAA